MTAYNPIIEKYQLDIRTNAPMHVGSASGGRSGILVHPISDLPFIQASGLAGVLRSASLALNGEEETERLFGSRHMEAEDTPAEAGSRLCISDGTFDSKTLHLETRPRVSINPETGSVSSSTIAGSEQTSGHKFEMEMIGTGAKVRFTLYLFHGKDDGDREALETVLAEMAEGHLQVGGQKSNGAGFLTIEKLLHKQFSLDKEEDRKTWNQEHEMKEDDYTDILHTLAAAQHSVQAYDIIITGKTEGSLLVKSASVAEFGEGAPDSENMKNAAGQYIIPGSSLKGALRNQISLIAKRLHKESLVKAMFGTGGEKSATRTRRDQDSGGTRGNVIVRDTIIGKDAEKILTKLQHCIHIDAFTGGVMQTGLFADRTVSGEVALHLIIDDYGNPESSAGMVILAARDLAEGLWNIGSGFNVGRGFLSVEKVCIRSLKTKDVTEVSFGCGDSPNAKGIVDPAGRLQDYLQAVAQWKEE